MLAAVAPDTSLAQFVDDLGLESEHEDSSVVRAEHQCAFKLACACAVLFDLVEYHMEGGMALDKSAAVASTPAVLSALQISLATFNLPRLGQEASPSNLGVDHRAGKRGWDRL